MIVQINEGLIQDEQDVYRFFFLRYASSSGIYSRKHILSSLYWKHTGAPVMIFDRVNFHYFPLII